MRKIKNGEGVEVGIYLNGEVKRFKLALFQKRNEWYDKDYYELRLVSEDEKFMLKGDIYSGGATGFGCSELEYANPSEVLIPIEEENGRRIVNDYYNHKLVLLTTDLNEINRIADQEELKEKEEREKFIKKQSEKVEKYNAQPKEVELCEYYGTKFVLKRGDAAFNPNWSSGIKVTYKLEYIRPDRERSYLWLSDYITRDEKLLTKKFHRDLYQFFDRSIATKVGIVEAKAILANIYAAYKNKKEEMDQLLK